MQSSNNDDRNSPDDAQRSVERKKLIFERKLGVTVAVALDISQVANMTLLVFWGTVILVEGVKMRPGGGTSIRKVSRDATYKC